MNKAVQKFLQGIRLDRALTLKWMARSSPLKRSSEFEFRDKTKLKGHVSRIEEEAFFITDAKTGAETRVDYGDVTQAKGNNLSTGAIIAIAAGVAAGVTLLVIYLIIAANG